jgi:hypothetical protein
LRVPLQEVIQRPNGDVIPGASVKVTVRNDGTIATVYTDEFSSSVLSNPLVSGADGLVSGWVNEGSYDLTITKGATTQTRRFEGVRGDKFSNGRPWYDVTTQPGSDFDAQFANAAAKATPGGILLVPDGSYTMHLGQVLPRVSQKGLFVRGFGEEVTRIIFDGVGHAFTFGGTSNADAAYGQWIEDLTIQCTYAGNAILGAAKFRAATHCGLKRVRINGSNLGNQILVDFDEGAASYFSFFNKVQGCDFRGIDQPTDVGVRLRSVDADGANANWIIDNFFGTLNRCVLVASGDENWIVDNHFGAFVNTGVRVDNSGVGNANGNHIRGNQFDGPVTAVDCAAGAVDTFVLFGYGTTAYINNGTNTQAFGNVGAVWTGAGSFKTNDDGGIYLRSYTVATRPSAAAGASQLIYVSDAAVGSKLQYSDGAAWVAAG